MDKLLCADFRRVWKDKLFLVMCILGAGFALMTPLLYRLLFGSIDPSLELITADFVSAKSQFFSAFSLGNNFGLIVPVLLAIILCKDFSFGTVRNKIISGKTRSSVFMSMFTVCLVTMWCIILLHAFLTLAVSLLFFDYQAESFVFADLLYFLESLCFEFLVYLFAASLVSWLCAAMKNVGLVIVLYVAIVMLLTIVSSILQVSITVLEFDTGSETTLRVLNFIQRINVFHFAAYIGVGESYTLQDALYLILPPTIGAGGLLSLGLLKFNKKDLK